MSPHISRRSILAIVATLLLTTAAACSTVGPRSSLPNHVPQVTTPDTSRVREFHTIQDLAADATAVVLVHGTGKVRTEVIAEAAFDVATVDVDKVLAGTVSGASSLELHTFATSVDSQSLLLASRQSFLIFVKPFYIEVGKATGEWIASGVDTGVFVELSDNLYHTVDPESPDLPAFDASRASSLNLRTSEFILNGGDLRGH